MTGAMEILQEDAENNRLPPVALKKLNDLESRLQDHFAIGRMLGEKIRDEARRKESLNRELRQLKEVGSRGGLDKQIEAASIAIDVQNKKLEELKDRAEEHGKRRAGRFAILTTLRTWLDDRRGVKLTFFSERTPDHGKKPAEGWSDCVARHRKRLATLRAELHRVASSPIPVDLAKERARKDIDQLAKLGTPNIEACLEGGTIRWPRSDITGEWGTVVATNVPAVRELMFWLFRDQIVERVEKELDALDDPSEALTEDQREKSKVRLLAEILDVERAEEAAIVEATLHGVEIDRRVDADPRAVLELDANVPGLEIGSFRHTKD